MVINTNLSALTSARYLAGSSAALAKSLARLSSGSKLTSPEDDAAGIGVAMRFGAQISRIRAVGSNLGNAISFSQTQDGFLSKIGRALDRMGELATLAQDVTKTTTDISQYATEYGKLSSYISDLGTKTFNGISLFSSTDLNVTTDSDSNSVPMTHVDMSVAEYVAITSGPTATFSDQTTAKNALEAVKSAIDTLAGDRANVGANIAVLSSYRDQLSVLDVNLSQAVSRIQDVDVADESTNFARYNILVQSGTAMLAQANQSTQGVLKLLQ